MFIWNDIKIKVNSDNEEFSAAIKKYINAVFDHEPDADQDILIEIKKKNMLPSVPESARKVKSLVFIMDDEEIRMEIFSNKDCTWYLYGDKAGIWINFKTNNITISLDTMPLAFEYYNILVFFLHPLGALLENFGYFRLRSSCIELDGNAMLISGVNGSGKSTAAFSAPSKGGSIISDDLVFIKKIKEGYVPSSLTRLVKLRNDSIKRFYPELLQKSAAAVYQDETYYFIEDINNTSDEAIINVITMIEQTGKSSSSHENAHPAEIVSNLFPSSVHTNVEANPGRKFIFITDMLNELHCKKVLFGTDMDIFYDTVFDIFKEITNR